MDKFVNNLQFISHDYSHQSTKEDPRMMAFFDSLVQREIEGWSDSEPTSHSESPLASDQPISEGRNCQNVVVSYWLWPCHQNIIRPNLYLSRCFEDALRESISRSCNLSR